ncbi:prepilin-type N-terminal cleavage/methylation domain-containing protein [Pseudomonas sp. 148P]|uniref:Prepilin-type N-terminal cleavage/methylation domain-containing protein n=1 Tax=Pseudomonas ulcerans TaxID=3115852 RepID=A0ABU7I146_9PSED|nr:MULTISPECIES: prepilin-type N-terminal cleavage/methylation domain-containing protein [unclassified Pseudomonas]MEE1926288.1 prepilin-type N-terminal cleavage/methylation domain-containing protein [Pseudomonas sp. 147P]MEE1937545.1 prepilin-type N-terminal cleavage/methylation domain-containing protein [Pseudomonas sp. 148P]
MRQAAGFSLLEVLLAMSLGLLLLLAGSRVFISALQSWKVQEAAARLQEDARFALHRLAGDIRMAGMFGCLRQDAMSFPDAATARLFEQPFTLEQANDGGLQSLTLISAEWGELAGAPDWTLVTDCRTRAVIAKGRASPGPGMVAVPIRQHVYRLEGSSLKLGNGSSNAVLVDNVGRLDVRRDDDRVMLSLTLEEPGKRVRPQTYELTVVRRNDH